MSSSFPPFSFLSKAHRARQVWPSSSMRRTRPKKPPRSFEPVSLQSFPSQPSPQERVPGRKRRLQRAAKRHPKTTFKSRFRFLFVPILRPFHVPRVAYSLRMLERHPTSTVDATTSSRQPVRFFCGADDDGDPPRLAFPSFCARVTIIPLPNPIPSNDDRSTNHSLEPVTHLSNSAALEMPRTPTTTCMFSTSERLPFTMTHPGVQARKEPRWTSSEHPSL